MPVFPSTPLTSGEHGPCMEHDDEMLHPVVMSTWMPDKVGGMPGKSLVFTETQVSYKDLWGRYRCADTSPTLTDCLWFLRTALGVVRGTQWIPNCTRWFLLSNWRVASFLDLTSLEPATLPVWWDHRLVRGCHRSYPTFTVFEPVKAQLLFFCSS
jgi:hypothetical protein